MKTLTLAFALTILGTATASAQRECGNYGCMFGNRPVFAPVSPGPGRSVQQAANRNALQFPPYSHTGNRAYDCTFNFTINKVKQRDARALRALHTTVTRGSAVGTPDYNSLLRQAQRSCR